MSSPVVLASLETIDKPLPASPDLASTPAFPQTASIRRISRLPPTPTISITGPSDEPQRYLFVGVRQGHRVGVYSQWEEVERQVINYPEPVYKTFSTRLAAEAFVAGWDGAGRHALPGSSPRPLREHLAMNFPSSVPFSASTSSRRPSYHTRLLSTLPPLPSGDWSAFDVSAMPSFYDRPPLIHSSSSFRHSLVRTPSPLRSQVDEEEQHRPKIQKATSTIGSGGLLSPPSSPENWTGRSSVIDRQRPTKPGNAAEAGLRASSPHRYFSASGAALGFLSPPGSPTLLSTDKRKPSTENLPRAPSAPTGLWADAVPPRPNPSVPQAPSDVVELADKNAPVFSRSGLKKSGVVMPVAASRTNSSSSLRTVSSRSSLRSPSSSSTSLASSSSTQSTKTVRRQNSSQDRLASFATTTQRELQLNDGGLLALSALSPPRPAFMRNTSSSSLSSDASGRSMGSLTSATSAVTSNLDSCDPIVEEDTEVQISCTRSDGDADGSVESSSMKSGISKEKKKGGGLFKRFSQALKLEKKGAGRRPSL